MLNPAYDPRVRFKIHYILNIYFPYFISTYLRHVSGYWSCRPVPPRPSVDFMHCCSSRSMCSWLLLVVVALLGCVCPYSVCLALPVTGGGRAQCVIGFEGSAALTFWAAGVNRGRTGRIAPRPGAAWHHPVRRCCSVSVYLCCCSPSIDF